MQSSYLYKNGDNKLYFMDCQYWKNGFKCEDIYYYKKKKTKEIGIMKQNKVGDMRNIIIS